MEWSLHSLLSLSIDKCKAIICISLHTTSANDYIIVDLKSGKRVMVPYTEKEKDLGVWISSDLKPSFRCQQIAAKAMQTLGRIKLFFKFLSCSSFKIFVPYLYPPSVRILCSSLVSILD